MSLSRFDRMFFKEYDRQNYNCLHFLVDFWRELLDIDVSCLLPKDKNTLCTLNIVDLHRKFKRVKKPKNICLCVCKTTHIEDLHVATYYKGNIVHLTEQGVQNLPADVSCLAYTEVIFYEYTNHN